jgi:cell filamentation protein, protein adenylyltransferase
MFAAYRLKKARSRFLESCRALGDDRRYWTRVGGFRRWFLELLSPVPPLAFHAEATGLWKALDWLEANARRECLSERTVQRYHSLVMEGVRSGGEYRTHPVAVVGSRRPGAAPARIAALMRQLDLTLLGAQKALDERPSPDREQALKLAVEVHHRIGWIHPFADANGRVARLAMNHLLRRYGSGYIIFPPLSERSPLWDALEEANRGNLVPMTDFAKTCFHRI